MTVYVKTDRKSSWHFCIVIMMMLFQCCNAWFIGWINETMGERCPNSRLERELRASTTNCSPVEFYHCLYNSDNQLVESCYEFKQVPAGYFPKFNSYGTGNPIDYDECPPNRYQAWPIKSYEIKECSSIKSECISEGQIQCDNGSSSADRTCKCDYKLGYAMNGRHCCSPLASSDCFCYKKCKRGQRLDADYNCIDVCLDGQNCSFKTAYSGTVNHEITTSGLPANHGDVAYPLGTKSLYITAALITIASFLGMLFGLYKNKYRGKRKYGMVIFFLFLVVVVCVIYIILDWESKLTPKYLQFGISFLAIVALIGCVSGILIIRFHDIPKRFYFFTEDYEIELYKVLQAAKDGNLEQLKILHEGKAVDIDGVDYDQRSALHLAACEGHDQIVKFLLDKELCNPGFKDRFVNTALEDAVRHKEKASHEKKANYEEVILLLKNHKTVSQGKKHVTENFRERKFREIFNATKNGHISELKRLMHNNTIMDLSNSSGRTALHLAAECGMVEVVEYLIRECKVSPFIWWTGKRPIDCIPNNLEEKTVPLRRKLEKYMNKLRASTTSMVLEQDIPQATQIIRMLNAASRGNLCLIRQFRESGYDMTLSDYDERTVLHIAASDNQDHIADYLLSNENFREIIKDKKDRWDKTPFDIAKESSDKKIYYTFLKHYKELIDTENDEYRTYQLLTAGKNGDIDTLRRLHIQKVNMNLRDYDGRTALHVAVDEKQVETVEFLLNEANVNPSIPDRENRKPINTAKSEEIKTLLEEAGRKSHKSNNWSLSNEKFVKIMNAAATGVLHSLENQDYRFSFFPMDSFDYFKNTPLHVAAAKAMETDVKYLLGKNASPFMRNSFWKTPVQLVKEKQSYWGEKIKHSKSDEKKEFAKGRKEKFDEILKILEGAETLPSNAEDVKEDENFKKYRNGERVFLFLNKAFKGDIKAIQRYLITDRNLINEQDYDGRTALHLAVAEGHDKLVKFILSQENVNSDIKDRWKRTPIFEAQENNDVNMIELLMMHKTDEN